MQYVESCQVIDEASLVKKARGRDRAALEAIYDQYSPQIYAYLFRRIGNRETAEDLTGEVFFRMLEAQRKGQFARKSLAAWLFRIAHNLVVDHYRRHPAPLLPLGEQTGAADGPGAFLEKKQASERLQVALHQLSADQQQVLVLRFGQGMSAMEVAEVLSKPEGAVRSLQHRALATLRRLMQGEER